MLIEDNFTIAVGAPVKSPVSNGMVLLVAGAGTVRVSF